MAFMISGCHNSAEPIALLRNTAPALKPAATLIFVERDTDKWNTASSTGTTREVFLYQVAEAGYELAREGTFLAHDTSYILRLKAS